MFNTRNHATVWKGRLLPILVVLGAGALIAYGWPQIQGFLSSLGRSSSQVTASSRSLGDPSGTPRPLKMYSVLPRDAIPAILVPEIITAREANESFKPQEQVLGLSIDGIHRAYSIPHLSSHEIVNDQMAGRPVAVTW